MKKILLIIISICLLLPLNSCATYKRTKGYPSHMWEQDKRAVVNPYTKQRAKN